MNKFNILFALLVISFQTQAQKSMSLQDCISQAIQKSLNLQEANLGIENAELNYNQAKSNRHPNLSGFGGLNYNFGRSIDPTTNEFITSRFSSNNYGLSSGVLLYGGNRLQNAIKQANINLEASRQDKKQAEADIALQVATAYLNALFAIETLNVAETQLRQSEKQLEFVNKLIDAGVRPANESLDMIAMISANNQSIIQAKNSRDIALLQLKQLIRMPANEEISINAPEGIDVLTDPDLVSFTEVYELTLRSQPAVQAAILREESSAYNLEIAKADMLPSLSLGGNLSTAFSNQGFRLDGTRIIEETQVVIVDGNPVNFTFQQEVPNRRDANFGEQLSDNVSAGLGLSLNVPIYNRGLTKTNIERAKLDMRVSEISTMRLKENIQILVQQALADARANKKNLAATEATTQARKAALDNAIKKFEAGSINSFDLTTIQSQYEDASIQSIIAKYNYLFSVKVLEFYMGKSFKL